MLIGRPTKYGTGIEIFGDYRDLKSLYCTVHSSSGAENSPGNGLFMYFAYEIRKANDNLRETDTFVFDDELVIYRGFKIFWPHFLTTIKLMREGAGLKISTPDIQADIYRLESIAESSLKSFDVGIGTQIWDWLSSHHIQPTEYIEVLIMRITFNCLQAKDGKERFKQLKKEIETLLYNHPDHIEFKKYLEAESKRLNCKIPELDIDLDFEKTGYKW